MPTPAPPAIPLEFLSPPRSSSIMPLWFWNDVLREEEIERQMDDFAAHGVYGFVIHPRVGLPRDTGFMSDRMAHFVRFAVAQAARRDMKVVLFDEGMYPSGSASGLVVAADPAHRCRCLARVELPSGPGSGAAVEPGWNLVTEYAAPDGRRWAIVDRPVKSHIRGLHYVGEGPEEDAPPAADILNPDAVGSFIRIVYDGFARWVGSSFGSTVIGIFTDEPNMLGKCREKGVMPGTAGILQHVNRILGFDFTPHLPALWERDWPQGPSLVLDYRRALALRLQETYYCPLHDWCVAHGVALMGHPSKPDDIGCERWFHAPGQDLVWRKVLASEPSAIEGAESTQAKCSSSAMIHLRRRHNSSEIYGAYGHELTWDEVKGLADWCFVRGVNLLMPHAFYYSVRGPRRDERPPDVGPNSPWWNGYKTFADYCARLSWLNTDSRHHCSIAILGEPDHLPWHAAKVCLQNQRDFNYLEARHLWEDATVDSAGVHLAGMDYGALIVETGTRIPQEAAAPIQTLRKSGRLIEWNHDADPLALLQAVDRLVPRDLVVSPPQSDLRCRHVTKNGRHYYLLTNEGQAPLKFTAASSAAGRMTRLDPFLSDHPSAPLTKMADPDSLPETPGAEAQAEVQLTPAGSCILLGPI